VDVDTLVVHPWTLIDNTALKHDILIACTAIVLVNSKSNRHRKGVVKGPSKAPLSGTRTYFRKGVSFCGRFEPRGHATSVTCSGVTAARPGHASRGTWDGTVGCRGSAYEILGPLSKRGVHLPARAPGRAWVLLHLPARLPDAWSSHGRWSPRLSDPL
jgi:hypothetical protein